MLMPPDLTDWVPDDHVVWSILGAVEQMDLTVCAREQVVPGDRAGVP